MTETTTLSRPPPQAAPGANLAIHPADILLHLVVSLLAPAFLAASGGDIALARISALETVNAYRANNQADLISIVQIIAFGLAALGSLGTSMTGDLSLSLTLRLRGNANACNRAAEHNRRALTESLSRTETPAHTLSAPDQGFDVAEVTASVAAVRKQAAETNASLQAAERAAVKAAAAPAAETVQERQLQAAWASAMADVAAEFTADLPNLPPIERRAMTIRANALSSCARDLLGGHVTPRPRPGDLATMMRPNPV
jgi:hypothetical protein